VADLQHPHELVSLYILKDENKILILTVEMLFNLQVEPLLECQKADLMMSFNN